MSTARTVAYFLAGAFVTAAAAAVLTLTSRDPLLELAVWAPALVGGACFGLAELQTQIRNVGAGESRGAAPPRRW